MKILRIFLFVLGLLAVMASQTKLFIKKIWQKLWRPRPSRFQLIDFFALRALFLVLTFTLWSSLGLTSCGFLQRITKSPIRADFDKLLKGDTVVLKKKILSALGILPMAKLI
jgi:hypothetical protein